MVKVDLKKFITDRVWFGWWYRDFSIEAYEDPTLVPWLSKRFVMERYFSTKWIRDPNSNTHWTIKKIRHLNND